MKFISNDSFTIVTDFLSCKDIINISYVNKELCSNKYIRKVFFKNSVNNKFAQDITFILKENNIELNWLNLYKQYMKNEFEFKFTILNYYIDFIENDVNKKNQLYIQLYDIIYSLINRPQRDEKYCCLNLFRERIQKFNSSSRLQKDKITYNNFMSGIFKFIPRSYFYLLNISDSMTLLEYVDKMLSIPNY